MDAHLHSCHCGGVDGPHMIADAGCHRRMEAPPVLVGDKWAVDCELITDFTLREQRGYFQHGCGCWSSSGRSVNSIGDNW